MSHGRPSLWASFHKHSLLSIWAVTYDYDYFWTWQCLIRLFRNVCMMYVYRSFSMLLMCPHLCDVYCSNDWLICISLRRFRWFYYGFVVKRAKNWAFFMEKWTKETKATIHFQFNGVVYARLFSSKGRQTSVDGVRACVCMWTVWDREIERRRLFNGTGKQKCAKFFGTHFIGYQFLGLNFPSIKRNSLKSSNFNSNNFRPI